MSQGQFQFDFRSKSRQAERPAAATEGAARPKPSAQARAAAQPRIYSVTQLTRMIKLTLDEHLPGKILLQGEISNFKHHSRGHMYFDLKDEGAVMPAVIWKGKTGTLKFAPENGMAVIAAGRIDVYEPHGKYQFYVDKLEPAGVGALELAFRQLAEKLRAEGLFDETRKKPLPRIPQTLAIITAEGSAALEDIRKTLHRRFPIVRKLLFPTAVQGQGAGGQIATRIAEANRRSAVFGGIDLIILARGGGSLEDLWAFNEEVVARAIFASAIPIITGVGHEIDVTIADMVADARAATPTAAAETAVPVLEDLQLTMQQGQRRLSRALQHRLQVARQGLTQIQRRPFFARPTERLNLLEQTLDQRLGMLQQALMQRLNRLGKQLETATTILRRIEPHQALGQARLNLSEQANRLRQALHKALDSRRHRLQQRDTMLHAHRPTQRIEPQRKSLLQQQRVLDTNLSHLLRDCRQQTVNWESRLRNLDPHNVLQRGYSITRDAASGTILKPDAMLRPGQSIRTELAGNVTVESDITHINKPKGSA